MLRTSGELLRYDVEAADGRIGRLTDLLFDDQSWRIEHLVVDTGGFLRHHRVAISPERIQACNFEHETIVLDTTRQDVEGGPAPGDLPPSAPGHHRHGIVAVQDYCVVATDETLGKVHGVVVETATWTIRYFIVDTGEWLSGKFVLMPLRCVASIDDGALKVIASVTSDTIRHCPAYDESAELNREYESFLHKYYDWPPYWDAPD